jgi:hypothetical protein
LAQQPERLSGSEVPLGSRSLVLLVNAAVMANCQL